MARGGQVAPREIASGAAIHGTHPDYRPHRLLALWRSTIGKKYVAAITGVIIAVWIVLHMLGNLKAIEGPGHGNPALDRYAHFLRTAGSPVLPHDMLLWFVRGILILAVVLHITVVVQLWLRNRRAKPPAFRGKPERASIAARLMPWTGLLILVFVIFHLLQFTTRTIHPTPLHDGTVYANVYYAFQKWWLVLLYVAAVVALGFHLWHALWSGAQTAGVDNPDRNWFWRRLAAGVTLVVVIGFALVPTLIWTGALPKPTPTRVAWRSIIGVNINGIGPYGTAPSKALLKECYAPRSVCIAMSRVLRRRVDQIGVFEPEISVQP
jgi:succinate dehydrogenase / fumarate reductase cytochrome b subunit